MPKTENSKNKALMVGTIIYAIGNFGTKILSFLIVPLYTYYIDPIAMGEYDLIITTISLLTPIITFQISDGAYAYMIKKTEKSEMYIVAVYKFVLLSTLIGAVIILSVNVFISIPYAFYFVLLLLSSRWLQTMQKLLRGLKNQKLFAFSGVVYTTIFLVLNVLQIVVLKQGVEALFQSAIIANLIAMVLILAMEKRMRKLHFSMKSFELQKEMLKFSIPIIPNQLNWWIISSSDRYIIKFFLGSAANGIYAIAHKFPSLLQLIFNIFYQAWQDMAVADTDQDYGQFYTKVFRYYYKLSFTLLIFLIPFTKFFIRIAMSEAYSESTGYIAFLYLGTVFQAFSAFFGVGYMKNNKTSQAATTSVYGALINAVVNIGLIQFIGLYAAAISTFVGFFIMFLVRVKQTKDIMKITIAWREFILLFVLAFVSACIASISGIAVDTGMMIVGALLFVLYNNSELKMAINIVAKKLKR